jgi:uncharacterized protein YyaL (SSP411 family)
MKTNRLAHEKSPYLLQHQSNPVDWYPWGDEAFEKARSEQKPIFLSVGYSTCHWCHVMERESFENETIAAQLNASFVSIKVDREERPDVDRVYMAFVQATTGAGGWPMTVFLTPDLKPFFGGTYFPPENHWGHPGLSELLHEISVAWKADNAKLAAHGAHNVAALQASLATAGQAETGARPLDNSPLGAAYEQIARSFDAGFGGFSAAPKFPRPVTLNFLFRYYARNPRSPEGANALEMALLTLRKMAEGGIHDHLGGGFHRYSVDRFWHIPHFEKMLYDQGQLACSYLEAFQITRVPFFAEVARDGLDYVRRDLTSPEGGFYSAEDADSPLPGNPQENGEGAFYVWTLEEIEDALGGDAATLFNRFFGVEPEGNAPSGSDPHGEFAGTNTLIQRHSLEELARLDGRPVAELAESLAESRRILLERRSRRPRPRLDDKIITSWNGLLISAFARASQILGEEVYLESARRAALFIQTHLCRDGRLLRSFRAGAGPTEGFAEDYAFLIQGLLDLYEASGEIAWLQWAAELQTTQDALFFDETEGGYFSTDGEDLSILFRTKEDYDGAEPSSNSVAALNALRLGQMLDDAPLRDRGERTIRAFWDQLRRMPIAMPQMLVALDFALSGCKQIVLAGRTDATEGDPLSIRPLLRELHARFTPNKVILFADGGPGQEWLRRRLDFIKTARPVNGKAAAYICEDSVCQAPVTAA